MLIDYPHKRGIHCETANTKNLLDFFGYNYSEPLIFGIGSGIDFIHFPFVLFNDVEAPVYRTVPVSVFKLFTSRMNIDTHIVTLHNRKKLVETLNSLLEKGIPTGILTEVYNLPYFKVCSPDDHFKGHHAVVVGKEGNEYLISDTEAGLPFDGYQRIHSDDLINAIMPKSNFIPTGKLFYLDSYSQPGDIKSAIIKGIKTTCYKMLKIPLPFFGYKGIKLFSDRIRLLEKKYGTKGAIASFKWQYLSSEVITGGSAYRFMYLHFLEEASRIFQDDVLVDLSKEMLTIANHWQKFALELTRAIKNYDNKINLDMLGDMMASISPMEKKLFYQLNEWVEKK